MKNISLPMWAFIFASLFLSSCDKGQPTASSDDAKNSNASATKHFATDKWLGQWNGPEGTFLKLSGGDGKYEIIIQDLDGAQTFNGKSLGSEIEFERNGVKEIVRATSGADTGMKWLSDKSNCLTVKAGEGYCR